MTQPEDSPAKGSGRGPGGPRGNPAPRRALARVRPLDAEESQVSPAPADAGGAASAGPPAAEPASPAAAPGGTQGRDLLIPSRQSRRRTTHPNSRARAAGADEGSTSGGKAASRSQAALTVPSVADLMPPSAPAGRRAGGVERAGHRAGADAGGGPKPRREHTDAPAAGDNGRGGRKHDDGAVQGSEGKKRGGGKPGDHATHDKPTKDDKPVDLVVTVPKSVRKLVRARAAQMGLTPEAAVAELVRAWVLD